MSHNLDINNGQTSFVSAREDAWHQLGTVLDDSFTAEQAMEHGLLGGWNVRKAPLMAEVMEGLTVPVPDKYAVLRNNPVIKGQVDVLGTVGKAYQVLQNEELTGLLNTLVDESGAHFETAGALDGGKRVFVTMKMPNHIKIGGVDPINQYIAAMTSHDGSMSTTMMVTPVRIVCQNTMNLAFNNHSSQFRVRHTSGATKLLLQQARETLEFTMDYMDDFQMQANQLINTELTQSKFDEMITKAFGAPKDAPAATVTRTENKLDEMSHLFADAHTHKDVRNTAWAGLNALTEWHDHFSPVRGAEDDSLARSQKAVMEPKFKNQALKLMMELV